MEQDCRPEVVRFAVVAAHGQGQGVALAHLIGQGVQSSTRRVLTIDRQYGIPQTQTGGQWAAGLSSRLT